MEALKVPKSHEKRLRERVAAGLCISIDSDGNPCNNPIRSRGICECCKQHFYLALRKIDGAAAKKEFEAEQVALGRILPQGVQPEWTTKNPFLRPAS